MICNIVIGKPLVPEQELLARDTSDWEHMERGQTYYTDERFLPKILVDIQATTSISEIRRNRPDLVIKFDKPTCYEFKLGKRKFYVIVGE